MVYNISEVKITVKFEECNWQLNKILPIFRWW